MRQFDIYFWRAIGAIKGVKAKLDGEAIKKSNPRPVYKMPDLNKK